MDSLEVLTEGFLEELIYIRRSIHKNPELAFQEVKTSNLIRRELVEAGIKIVDIGVKTGILGLLRGEKESRAPGTQDSSKRQAPQKKEVVTALRADIDALPISEVTGLAHASCNPGVMHACGHDGNATVVLGAAKVLAALRHEFNGTVKLIFQPAEEIFEGAKAMVAEGVLKDPKVDTILAIHAWPDIPVGKIGLWSGPYQASADWFKVTLTGKGAHGAYPHQGIDPVLATANAITQIQNIISRSINALDNVVISVCTLNGGKAFNVIPEEVEFGGTVRCQSEEVRRTIESKIDAVLKGIAISSGCAYRLEFNYGVPAVVNNPEIVDDVFRAARQAIGPDGAVMLEQRAMSSEDFSMYLQEVPKGAMVRLGTRRGESSPALHNDHFDFNDDAIKAGVKTLVQYVLNQNC